MNIKRLITLLLFLPLLIAARAQGDFPTWEAYINDHNTQHRLLSVRKVVEAGVYGLHKSTESHTKDYKEINDELEKYRKAFDILTLVFNSIETGFGVYNVINDFSSSDGTAQKYIRLVNDFANKCTLRGNIVPEDTMVISIAYKAVESIKGDLSDLEFALTDLFLLCSGKVQCTTADLANIFGRINRNLDHIQIQMRRCYWDTYKYVQFRTTFWKRDIYRDYTKKQIADAALQRWHEKRKNRPQRQ